MMCSSIGEPESHASKQQKHLTKCGESEKKV